MKTQRPGMAITTSQLADRLRQPRKAERLLVAAEGGAIASTMRDYATGALSVKIADRFKPQAFGRYRFSQRSAKYTKKQYRFYGKTMPYVSPGQIIDPEKLLKLVALVARAKVPQAAMELARMMADASKNKIHARDIVAIPGIGHNVRMTMCKGVATVRIAFPSMRRLNHRPRYAREFADINRNSSEKTAIVRISQHRARAAIMQLLTAGAA